MFSTPYWRALSSCALMLFIAVPTAANWSDNFDNGVLQQPWQFFDPFSAPLPFTADSVNDQLEITSAAAVNAGGPPAVVGIVPTFAFADVRMSGWINAGQSSNTSEVMMLIFRGNPSNNTFYALEINYGGDELILWRNDSATTGTNMVVTPFTLDNSDALYVESEALGTSLRAKVFDAPGGNLLATAFTNDSTYSNGVSGLLTQQNNFSLPLLGVFDDITAEAIVAGDYNDDGAVDLADYTVWRNNLGATSGTLRNDPNDTTIGIDQYNTWRQNYGQIASSIPLVPASTVPEPATWLMLIGTLIALICSNHLHFVRRLRPAEFTG